MRNCTIRVNKIKSNIEEIENALSLNNISFERVDWYEDAFILQGDSEEIKSKIEKLDIYKDGKIYVQSLSSMIPPIVLEPNTNENILDMCAAPGGKTTQICSISSNSALVTACEMNTIRYDRLKYNVDKQSARVNLLKQDSRTLSDFLKFDKVLLDTPCSGSGTQDISFYENGFDVKNKFNENYLNKLNKAQTKLLEKAINITSKGGIIVYSTCSIIKDENEQIIEKFIKSGKVQIIPIDIDKFKSIPMLESTINGVMTVKPTIDYEGFFVAKLKKL